MGSLYSLMSEVSAVKHLVTESGLKWLVSGYTWKLLHPHIWESLLEFSTQLLKIVGIRAGSLTVESHKVHLPSNVVPGLLSSRGTSVGWISQNLWPWFCVVGNVCLVLRLQPFLCCLSYHLGEGSHLPAWAVHFFVWLSLSVLSYLFLLCVCREGIACYLPAGKPCHLLRFVATALGRSHLRKPYLCHFWGSLSPLSRVVRGNTFIGSRDYRTDHGISSDSNFIVTSIAPLRMNPH